MGRVLGEEREKTMTSVDTELDRVVFTGDGIYIDKAKTEVNSVGYTVVRMTYEQVKRLADIMGKKPFRKIGLEVNGRMTEKWKILGRE